MGKRTIWQKIWEPADSQIFGELALIVAAIFISKGVEGFFPDIGKWVFLGLGFLFVLWGVKLLRKSEKKTK